MFPQCSFNVPRMGGPPPAIVVVHGAGSFGHFQASESGVAKVRIIIIIIIIITCSNNNNDTSSNNNNT
jgi:hypothetical protein